MSAPYTGNPTVGESPASIPVAGTSPIVTIPVDVDPNNVATMFNQQYKMFANQLAYNMTQQRGLYGDGSDGYANITGFTQLTRDMYYSSLVINTAGTLYTSGYRVFVNTLLTVVSGGIIHNRGFNGDQGTSGGLGGASGTLLGGAAGGTGSGGGNAGTGLSNGLGGNGGAGGTGSSSGGVVVAPLDGYGRPRNAPDMIRGYLVNPFTTPPSLVGVRGGAGGGGSGATNNYGNGGGGGGLIVLATSSASLSGVCIDASGGNGTAPFGGAGSGGGGGGGGGLVMWLYGNIISGGSAASYVKVSGGLGGTGSGTSGANGSAGTFIGIGGI